MHLGPQLRICLNSPTQESPGEVQITRDPRVCTRALDIPQRSSAVTSKDMASIDGSEYQSQAIFLASWDLDQHCLQA
jgi:hypothetical protein